MFNARFGFDFNLLLAMLLARFGIIARRSIYHTQPKGTQANFAANCFHPDLALSLAVLISEENEYGEKKISSLFRSSFACCGRQ